MSLKIELPSSHIFIHKNIETNNIFILLPCLPPLMDLTSSGYLDYLNGFNNLVIHVGPSDMHKLVSIAYVNHTFSSYKFVLLKPIANALLRNKMVTIIPFCAKEGYSNELTPAVEIEVIRHNNEYTDKIITVDI